MSTAWKIIIGVLLAVVATFTIGVLSGKIWWFSEDPPLMVIPDMDDQFTSSLRAKLDFLPTIARSEIQSKVRSLVKGAAILLRWAM